MAGLTPPSPRFELVPVDRLRPHEEVDPDDVEDLAATIREDGHIQRPIVADASTFVILDGHHRCAALEALGCELAACHLVDYDDPSIQVERWEDGSPMDKERVVQHALDGDLLPVKTTRHQLLRQLPSRPTPLEKLRPEETRRDAT